MSKRTRQEDRQGTLKSPQATEVYSPEIREILVEGQENQAQFVEEMEMLSQASADREICSTAFLNHPHDYRAYWLEACHRGVDPEDAYKFYRELL